MKRYVTLAAAAVVLFMAVACGDDGVGVPQPVPIPKEFLLRGSVGLDVDAIRMVGLPGAVARAGDVILDGGRGEIVVRSTEVGSFVASVPYTGNVVQVRFETSEAVSYSVNMSLVNPVVVPAESVESVPIVPPIDGVTTIQGATEPDLGVFAANIRSGDVVLGTSDALGFFTLQLPAQTGDVVEVYANLDPLADPWTLTVP